MKLSYEDAFDVALEAWGTWRDERGDESAREAAREAALAVVEAGDVETIDVFNIVRGIFVSRAKRLGGFTMDGHFG